MNKYSANIIQIRAHSFLEMARASRELINQDRTNKLKYIVLNPASNFVDYIRETIRNPSAWALKNTGNDIMILRYAHQREIPISYLTKENASEDLNLITGMMDVWKRLDLSAIILQRDVDFFRNLLSQNNFEVKR